MCPHFTLYTYLSLKVWCLVQKDGANLSLDIFYSVIKCSFNLDFFFVPYIDQKTLFWGFLVCFCLFVCLFLAAMALD